MAYVTLTNISVLDNPTSFLNPFQFEVTFECIHSLDDGTCPYSIIMEGGPFDTCVIVR